MGKKILIVEDNAKNRLLLRDILIFHGYEVFEAENGTSGVLMTKEHLPDLVLMDMQMPVMDGRTAFQRLRNTPETSTIKVVALTAFGMKDDKEKLLEAGFDGYLSKPLDLDSALALVKEMTS